MGEWIRHRGSKTMPKRLEGMRFAAKLRDGSVHVVSSDFDYLRTSFAWVHKGNMDEIMQYSIIGKIEPPSWPEDRIDVIGQNGNTGEHYNTVPFAGVEIVTSSQSNDTYELQWSEQDMAPKNKYQRAIKGVTVDVYDVLVAFGVTCPAMAHAIKKMLMPGQRGSKDAEQDKREAIQAIERSIELNK